MESDDLNTPLGQKETKRRFRPPVSAPQALAGVLALFGLVAVGWAMFVNDPLGGEPVAIVATKPAGSQAKSGGDDARDGGPAAMPADTADAKAIAKMPPPAAGKTITIIDGSSGKRHEVVIPGSGGEAGVNAANQPAGSKPQGAPGPQSALPAAPNGARAFAQYAKPRVLPANRIGAPRIAIVVGGIGIGAAATAEAFAKLPAPVTFALAPYGDGLDELAERARAANHEVLLQVPMEPFDYPNNDPGPRTLLASLTPEQNIDRLRWLMTRFQGYVGLVNYMGAKFTASEQALSPVMRETARRGVIYVDDGASARSVAEQLAGSSGVPFVRADVVLDTVPTPVEIERALARLELAARERGQAVGFASAQPAAIAAIAEWAQKIEDRGYVLVPITMAAVKGKAT